MNQRGASFLEIVVVLAIILIAGSLVEPSIQSWRYKRALEADFVAVLTEIDYLKTRTRLVHGTGLLLCPNPKGDVLTYQISTNPQSSTSTVASGFQQNIVEDPRGSNPQFNVLSGKSQIVSGLCNGLRAIFVPTGQSGIEGTGAQIDLEIDPVVSGVNQRAAYGAYRVQISPTTGFVQKYQWSISKKTWLEID